MEPAVKDVIERCAKASKEGALHFGEVVAALTKVGVESYLADYRAATTTYYLPDGDTLTLASAQPDVPIGVDFGLDGVRRAIQGAQRDEIRYPEFVKLTRAAGCVGYIVWLTGRHVVYFGRSGQTHVERFPD